jgi:uncharacterized membrane protein
MRGIYRFLKSTTIGGIVFLVPVVVLSAVVIWAVTLAYQVVVPLFEWLPDKTVGGVSLTAVATLGGLIAACFVAGLIAETAILRRLGDRAERLALFVPGYALMKSVGANLVGIQSKRPVRTVLVRFPTSWQFGFLMDVLPDERQVVFVPGVPRALVGTLHIVSPENVQPLKMSVSAAMDVLSRLGVDCHEPWTIETGKACELPQPLPSGGAGT